MSHLSNVRYGYFDALRFFSMLLVVFWHVMLFSIGNTDGINSFFCSFFLPSFFFVSGFFAYKPMEMWNKFRIWHNVTRKFKVQIIGALLFHFIYIIFIKNKFPDLYSLLDPEGYWFTFVLFRIFIGYLIVVVLSKLSHCSEITFWILLLSATSICIMIYASYSDFIKLIQWSTLSEAILYQFFYKLALYYFPYFTLGIIARAKLGLFEKFLSHNISKIIAITTVMLIWSFISLDYPIPLGYSPLSYPFRIIILILIIQFFYNVRHEFDRDVVFSKAIRFIGRRTLDIYFIHYFFLPDLHFLEPYLTTGNAVMIQLTVGITVSFIIIGLSLLVGQVIRMSPTLAEWLLGVKKKSM